MEAMRIYTDGGCSGNPGPGAWAYIILDGDSRRQGSGYDPATTNNRMELRAVIAALQQVGRGGAAERELEIYTDSRYVQQGISDWILRWEQNGWRTRAKKAVKNQELWQELRRLSREHEIRWHWLAGHAGHALNEECDRMVQEAIMRAGR